MNFTKFAENIPKRNAFAEMKETTSIFSSLQQSKLYKKIKWMRTGENSIYLVISEACCNETLLEHRNYRKMRLFSYTSFVKFYGKKIRSHKITVLYQNLCYNEVGIKKTALYIVFPRVYMVLAGTEKVL